MTDSQKILSGEMAHRLAAIDIGTNSIRLIVAEALRSGNYRILDEERESTRLGRRLAATGQLEEQAIEDSLATLRRFKQIAEGFQPAEIRTIATCAVREATNGPDFCRRAAEEVGLEIEVISAEKEAHLAFYSVQRNFDLADKNIVMADIGGGSTEIVLASGNLIEAIYPTDLGAVRMTEKFGTAQVVSSEEFARFVRALDRALRKAVKGPTFVPQVLIGSGGTFTSLAAMVMAQKNQSNLPVSGYSVSHADLSHLLDRLRKMPVRLRAATPGLSPDRADIIVAGLTVIDRLLHFFKVNTVQVHSRGVRDGLLLAMIERSQGGATPTVDRDAAIDAFATACRTEIIHSRHIALLASQIFDHLAGPLKLNPADRPLLETAARLQDVGYLINYEQHHKHSYHLILNSRLPGFQPHELELIANIARYHRGSEPKKKHANFKQLTAADRHRVLQLAAILRLAGGLDRSHSHAITGVRASVRPDGVELLVAAETFPEVDLWGARRRAELFEVVFRTSLTIEWQGNGHAASGTDVKKQTSATNGAEPADGGTQSDAAKEKPAMMSGHENGAAKPTDEAESSANGDAAPGKPKRRARR